MVLFLIAWDSLNSGEVWQTFVWVIMKENANLYGAAVYF